MLCLPKDLKHRLPIIYQRIQVQQNAIHTKASLKEHGDDHKAGEGKDIWLPRSIQSPSHPDAKARLNIRRHSTSLSSFALLGYEDGGNLEWGLWFPDDTSFMETH